MSFEDEQNEKYRLRHPITNEPLSDPQDQCKKNPESRIVFCNTDQKQIRKQRIFIFTCICICIGFVFLFPLEFVITHNDGYIHQDTMILKSDALYFFFPIIIVGISCVLFSLFRKT